MITNNSQVSPSGKYKWKIKEVDSDTSSCCHDRNPTLVAWEMSTGRVIFRSNDFVYDFPFFIVKNEEWLCLLHKKTLINCVTGTSYSCRENTIDSWVKVVPSPLNDILAVATHLRGHGYGYIQFFYFPNLIPIPLGKTEIIIDGDREPQIQWLDATTVEITLGEIYDEKYGLTWSQMKQKKISELEDDYDEDFDDPRYVESIKRFRASTHEDLCQTFTFKPVENYRVFIEGEQCRVETDLSNMETRSWGWAPE